MAPPITSLAFPLIADVQLLVYDELRRDDTDGRATLLALRLTNREVSRHVETAFAKAFFTKRTHLVTQPSLQRLAQISSRPHFAKHVRDLPFVTACWGDGESKCFCGGHRSKITVLFSTILSNLNLHSTGPLRSLTMSDGFECEDISGVSGAHKCFDDMYGNAHSHAIPPLLSAIANTSFQVQSVDFGHRYWAEDITLGPAIWGVEGSLLPLLCRSFESLTSFELRSCGGFLINDGNRIMSLLSSATNLEVFKIATGGEEATGAILPYLDRALSRSPLRYISLAGISGLANHFADFFKNHQDTLTSVHLSFNAIPAGQCWEPILRNLATLPMLNKLKVGYLKLREGRGRSDRFLSSDQGSSDQHKCCHIKATSNAAIREEIDRFFSKEWGYH